MQQAYEEKLNNLINILHVFKWFILNIVLKLKIYMI